MTNWIVLSERKEKLQSLQRNQGNHGRFLISSYDVPEAIRGHYKAPENHFIIEFKYPDEERWKPSQRVSATSLRMGVKSMRLHGMEIDMAAMGKQPVKIAQLRNEISHAIKELKKTMNNKSMTINYELAGSAVKDANDYLFNELDAVMPEK
jgi:hypothetical protein